MQSLKILLLSIFLILISQMGNAQKFGVRTGINFANISGDDLDTSFKTGLFLGAYKEMTLVKRILFLQPEIQFSKEGFSTKEQDINIDYLTVPILAKVYIVKLWSFETGPQFGILLNDNLDTGDTNNFTSSWAFGMSFHFPLGFSINGRYTTGLNKTIFNTDGKNQVFQIGAAFQF